MSDDKTKKARNRIRIDISEDYELRYWTKQFGVTTAQLEAAVREVRTNVEDIAIELGK